MVVVPEEIAASTNIDRPAVSARWLALLSGAIALALAIVVYVAYRGLIHYERRAIEHVPPGATLGLRVDVEQVILFEPVRKHLLPLVDRIPLAGDVERRPPAISRLQRLREQAGLNLGFDLRELVFARLPSGGWVLALGGIFGSRPLLGGIERVLREEAGVHSSRQGAILTLQPSGLAIAQADDGILLIASGAAPLELALSGSRNYEALGLDRQGAAAFAALPSAFEGHAPGTSPIPGAAWTRSTARLDLGDPLELSLRIEHAAPSDADSARRIVEGWLGDPARDDRFVPRADWGGERAVLARARFSRNSETVTSLSSGWQRSELDRAARSLANWLEARLRAPGPAAQ
jgi:hypothetical protein